MAGASAEPRGSELTAARGTVLIITTSMKQVAQNYRSGELTLLEVPAPACRPGGVLVRTAYSVISAGTEMMKISESKLSLLGKARARPDQVKKVIKSVQQQGMVATYQKVRNRLDSYTPLGYSLAGVVIETGDGVTDVRVGQAVACAGNEYALHAEYNWVPANLFVAVPAGVALDQAAFATVGAIALQGMRQAEIHLGESACVIGLGLLGQILVRLLRGAGVRATGIDIVAERCRLAESAGAAACATPDGPGFEELARRINELTGGHGVDCVFLTTGSKDNKPVEIAAQIARDRGRIVDIGKCNLDLPWNEYYGKELDVRFSRSYGPGRYDPNYEEGGIDYPIGYVRWTERRNMECILALLAEGRLDLSSLITDVFAFESALEAYDQMRRGSGTGLGVLFKYGDSAPPGGTVSTSRAPRAAYGGVRLGVIGAGNYASSMLLPHLARNPDVSLVEVATNTGLSSANAVKKFGFARCSTSSTDLLAASDIDAVLIATRHASHSRLVCAALRAGKAVLVEKPLAITQDGLAEILRTVAETGNDRIMVGFNRRFSPLLDQLKNEWGARSLPHVVQYRVNAGPLENGSWYRRTETEGSRFVGEGGHFIDTVGWWLGADPVQVLAAATAGDADNLSATLIYADGSVATIIYLTQADPRVPKEQIGVFGEGKAVSFDNFHRFEMWRGGRLLKQKRGLDKGQVGLLKAFIGAVKRGDAMPIALDSLVATTAATLATQLAIGRNTTIGIDAFIAQASKPCDTGAHRDLERAGDPAPALNRYDRNH